MLRSYFFFFFQAEDGIRDGTVTGVQTCALPISWRNVVCLRSLRGSGGGGGWRTFRVRAGRRRAAAGRCPIGIALHRAGYVCKPPRWVLSRKAQAQPGVGKKRLRVEALL